MPNSKWNKLWFLIFFYQNRSFIWRTFILSRNDVNKFSVPNSFTYNPLRCSVIYSDHTQNLFLNVLLSAEVIRTGHLRCHLLYMPLAHFKNPHILWSIKLFSYRKIAAWKPSESLGYCIIVKGKSVYEKPLACLFTFPICYTQEHFMSSRI